MIPALLDHLWQSTLVALAAGLLILAFRSSGAGVRYGLWFAASAKFLVPFAAFAALGRLLTPAIRPPAAVTPDAVFIAQAIQPFSRPHSASAVAQLSAPATHAIAPYAASPALHVVAPVAQLAVGVDLSSILLGVWALGCAAILLSWMERWAKVRSAMRRGAPLALQAPMPVLATPWTREPGLAGLWRPVLLVPDTLFDHLGQPEIEALVAHEACHVRRRDNLTAAIHMLVEALFWFHPLVWWIGARLIEERERACDEAVVRSGHDPAAYARSLVECCRLYLQSPLSCVAGASGSDLKQRVEKIMTAPPRSPLSRSKKTILFAAGVCALATPVAAGWLTSPAGREATARVVAATRDSSPGRGSPSQAGSALSKEASPIAAADDVAVAAPPSADAVEASPPVRIETAAQMSVAPVPSVEVSKVSMPTEGLASGALLIAYAAEGASSPDASPPWCHVPTREDMDRAYPRGADQPGIPGNATLVCRMASDQLSSCRIESESPGGRGFGKAAMFLSPIFRIPEYGDHSLSGHEVRVRIDFVPPRRAVLEPQGRDGRPLPGRDIAYWDRGPMINSAKYRPRRAVDELRGGQVVLRCRVQPTGALADCAVASEAPAGWGFGRGALVGATRDLKLSKTTMDGSPTAGRLVEVPLIFNAPCVPEGARSRAG